MPLTLVRPRTLAVGAALLAVVAVSGCGGEDAPTADAPPAATTDSAPATETPEPATTPTSEPTTETPEPTETATADPPETSGPSSAAPEEDDAAAAKAEKGLTKAGTSLKFGDTANVKIDYAGSTWIGGVKVTTLEKAPKSDYKELGVRGDAGNVYYLRYDVTYLAGKTKYPPEGGQVGWSKLHPEVKPGQRVSLINNPSFKKCSTVVYDTDKAKLKVGETAKNMCLPFLAEKGKLVDVVHEFYNTDKRAYEVITWKK